MFIKFYDKNKFINNTLCDKKLIHTSVINYMSQRQSNVVDVINESLLNEGLDVSINNDKAVVLYNKLVKEDIRIEGSTDSREDFVWLFDSDGKAIDFTQHVDLFKGVQLISNFLEQIYEINPDKISDVKISEFLKIYNTNEKLTVLDLYNHVSRLYKNEKDFFIRKTEVLTQTDVKSDEELINKAFKPFGEIGEQPFTLNGIAKKAMELDWEFVVNSAHVSVHLVPLCVNLVGYGAMLGTYIKLIHNRPIDSGLSEAQIKIQIMNKNRNLFLFAFFGAPLTLGLIKASSSSLKDIVTIKFPLSSELQLDNNNSIPNDFYDFVVIKLNDYLKNTRTDATNKLASSKTSLTLSDKQIKDLKTTIESCETLLKIKKNRSLVKLPIMVRPYNASKLTMIDYLKEKFDKVIVNQNNNKVLLQSMYNITINDEKVLFDNVYIALYKEFKSFSIQTYSQTKKPIT